MKSIIFVALGLATLFTIYLFENPSVDFHKDPNGGIIFQKENWTGALARAKKENKIVFLDVFATWCGPCKKLKKYTFSDQEVGTFFNQNFINVALDGEQEEGRILSTTYDISGYPTLLFIFPNGEILLKSSGYLTSKELLSTGKQILNSQHIRQ
ncbi:thioredoxin family protein [Aquirufa beregesia]